ncbi:MAG: HAD-IIIA family hydrolase [Candidatus Neomarinimicrobiota bacterium]|jgi:histidinol-phosphate phosphatase family protein
MKISTVFLDRDGVLNEDKPPYLIRVEDVVIHRDVPAALRQLTEAGIRVVVVSNQGGVGRGLHSYENAERIFRAVVEGAESGGGKILDWYFCPHAPEAGCGCRKPETGMIEQAVRKHGIDLKGAVLVGDGFGDACLAQRLQMPFFLVRQGWGERTRISCDDAGVPFRQVENLQDAVNRILKMNKENQI